MVTSFDVGCRITRGPSDWQILQQGNDAHAVVELAGTWTASPPAPGLRDGGNVPPVVCRVVAEDDQSSPSLETEWRPVATHIDGTWETSLRIPAGGLYRIDTGLMEGPLEWGTHGDSIHHVGVGDLWAVAGQSNAAGYGRGPVHDPPELGLAVLRNDGRWDLATHPLNDTRDSIRPNLERVNPGHSPALAFARRLRQQLGHPIGLLPTALGGSALASWNPVENPSAFLYANLIDCVAAVGGRIRGMVWYQGETDATSERAPTYDRRFREFIERLRHDLGAPSLPVVTTQINRIHLQAEDREIDLAWSIVREAQRRTARELDGVAVVGTLDLTLSDLIHTSPQSNLVLGQRWADAALAVAYGRPIRYRFPEAVRAVADAARAAVSVIFAHVADRLHSPAPIEEFVVEDAVGVVPIRRCMAGGSNVRIELARPLAARARVHGNPGADPSTRVFDAATNRPILGFHDLPVEDG